MIYSVVFVVVVRVIEVVVELAEAELIISISELRIFNKNYIYLITFLPRMFTGDFHAKPGFPAIRAKLVISDHGKIKRFASH